LNIGEVLAHPADIVFDLRQFDGADEGDPRAVDAVLAAAFGKAMTTKAAPSPLVGRLVRMKAELDRDEDTFGRKLRYLFWLN
jgi:hypothetical protein